MKLGDEVVLIKKLDNAHGVKVNDRGKVIDFDISSDLETSIVKVDFGENRVRRLYLSQVRKYTEIQAVGHEWLTLTAVNGEEPEPDWTVPSEVVVVGCDNGTKVIEWRGAHADSWFENEDPDGDTLDAPEGLHVFVCKIRGWSFQTMDGTEYESELTGDFRSLTDTELASLVKTGSIFS